MAKESISLSAEIPASAATIYHDWLDSKGHTAFTGGEAKFKHEVGANFTAWDGYISGTITELEPEKRIVQSWRTAEFAAAEEDSTLEIIVEDLGNNKANFTINHANIPAGDGEKYADGWQQHYINPMLEYYS